jgi:hypothetical protein
METDGPFWKESVTPLTRLVLIPIPNYEDKNKHACFLFQHPWPRRSIVLLVSSHGFGPKEGNKGQWDFLHAHSKQYDGTSVMIEILDTGIDNPNTAEIWYMANDIVPRLVEMVQCPSWI